MYGVYQVGQATMKRYSGLRDLLGSKNSSTKNRESLGANQDELVILIS